MYKMAYSLYVWLWNNGHRDIIPLIGFGHVELFTEEMQDEYIKWVLTDEGQEYLKGGSKYQEPV